MIRYGVFGAHGGKVALQTGYNDLVKKINNYKEQIKDLKQRLPMLELNLKIHEDQLYDIKMTADELEYGLEIQEEENE